MIVYCWTWIILLLDSFSTDITVFWIFVSVRNKSDVIYRLLYTLSSPTELTHARIIFYSKPIEANKRSLWQAVHTLNNYYCSFYRFQSFDIVYLYKNHYKRHYIHVLLFERIKNKYSRIIIIGILYVSIDRRIYIVNSRSVPRFLFLSFVHNIII